MKNNPEYDESCWQCKGSGKVPCLDKCELCISDGDCAEQTKQTYVTVCDICDGSGEIDGDAAKSHRRELQDEADEQRWEAERDDKMIGDKNGI